MKLTIIVVNYNVKYFLNICLKSLMAATRNMKSEIIIVDNASSDGSVALLKDKFPSVHLIENAENLGFGRACNQGIHIAKGEYVLIINPDTLVGESLLPEILEILDKDKKAGALGVQLVDGKGDVLRESKRSIPTLWSAFTKFSGLGDLFTRLPFFNQYYAPSLDYDEKGEIEVLPGAFMLIRQAVLAEVGGFDPQFFMYAEDIDLSYRISRAGYSILYAGHLRAIHFKGESTEKSLLRYTQTFFTSMRLFIQKYTGELYSPWVSWWLQRIIMIVQGVQGYWKTRSWSYSSRPSLEWTHWNLLLSSDGDASRRLDQAQDIQTEWIPGAEGLSDKPAGIHLRYIPALVRTELEFSLFLDVDSLTFDQIVSVWTHQNGRSFYLLDSGSSYFISSADKEKQGEVHNFGVT